MRSPGKVLVAAVLVLALGGSRAARADSAPTPLARGLAELEASTYDAAEKSLSAIKGADEAMAKAEVLALRAMAERLEQNESRPVAINISLPLAA